MRTTFMALCALGVANGAAWADPQPTATGVTELVIPTAPTRASYRDDPPLAKTYWIPALEIVSLNVAANIAARTAGQPWADITPWGWAPA